MNSRDLVELAALVAVHGPVLVRSPHNVPDASIEAYWVAAKCRLDRWARDLKRISQQAIDLDPLQRRRQWPRTRALLEEILTGEVLTRVWTAVMCAYDRRRDSVTTEPIVRSVMIGHLEARHRVLNLLVQGASIDSEEAVKLNRLRRRVERWTDMLIGYLSGLENVAEFAIDPDRAHDFAEDLSYQGRMAGGRHAWPLVAASLRAAFRQGPDSKTANADLNQRIASSIVACFPAELFDATGLFRSLWLTRLTHFTDDAEGMLDSLLADDLAPAPRGLEGRLGRFGPIR